MDKKEINNMGKVHEWANPNGQQTSEKVLKHARRQGNSN